MVMIPFRRHPPAAPPSITTDLVVLPVQPLDPRGNPGRAGPIVFDRLVAILLRNPSLISSNAAFCLYGDVMMFLFMMLMESPTATDPLVDAVARCLPMTDSAKRLSCLDVAGRALVDGVDRREVAVVRREEVRRVRRSLFGIEGEPGDALPGASIERIENLDTTITMATRGGNDHWTLRLAEGGRWETTEAWLIGRDPRPGTPVAIRRGSLGAYILKAGSERSVRVRRIN